MIIEIFKELTNIPRCSGSYEGFIAYMQTKSQEYGYECEVDRVNNVLCHKSQSAKLALQSHYDIVCLNENSVQIIEENGFFRAKASTLGADNGIGCAMMIDLMRQGVDAEFVFTSDEEIGLIGANDIGFDLNASYMLNLDTEEENEVYIGCAGGVDVIATAAIITTPQSKQYAYKLSFDHLAGGHSGVDIDKNIPNAFKHALDLLPNDAMIGSIKGGERINSIPKSVEIEFSSDEVCESEYMEPIVTSNPLSIDILRLISEYENGVLSINKRLDLPQTSQNLAIFAMSEDTLTIKSSLRSMDKEELNTQKQKAIEFFSSFGFDTYSEGKYMPWQPEVNEFSTLVKRVYQQHAPNADFKAIHAGLECAVFKEKYPNMLVTSIGPNIYSPHSLSERVEIASIHRVYRVVEDIVKEIYND
jgi:dipeptidase D